MSGTAIHDLTVAEVQAATAAGILDERLELVDGRLYEPMTPGPRHRHIVNAVFRFLLTELTGRPLAVQKEDPIICSPTSAPEPDVSVVVAGDFTERHPDARRGEIVAAIEVSDTTLATDREKVAGYAHAGVGQVVIIDVAADEFVALDGSRSTRAEVAGVELTPSIWASGD